MIANPVVALSVPWTNQGDAFARRDGAEALVDVATGRSFSYAEVIAACDAAGRAFLARGLQPGERVAVLAANGARQLFAIYGAMRAGLVAVPVNWKLPAATVATVVEDCGARLVLHDAARRGLCPEGPALVDIEGDWLDFGAFAPVVPDPHDAALFLYTSGSTGRPKGVVLSHHSHLWVLDVRVRASVGPGRALVAAPLYHMNALSTVQAAWATGGAVILLPGFEARQYIAAAAAHGATALTAVPTMIAMMLREEAALAAADLSGVTVVRVGSAPITEALVAEIRRVFPRAAMVNGYGTTEAGPVVFAPSPASPPTSVGAAHPEVQLRLMAEGVTIPEGPGEGTLEMRCPALMNCYHGLEEATARAMTADGFYRTGDVFQRDAAGYYSFVGRADDMFNSAGENIYPGEVEAVLARHPDVQQVAVVPAPDALKGHKPVAFVVARPGTHPTEAGLKAFVLAHAPAYHHPRRVWFLDALPLAGTNKIDRRALIEHAGGSHGDTVLRAAVVSAHGGPEQLVLDPHFPDPVAGEGDVVVRVRASSLNYHDVFTRRGMPGIKVPLPVIMGLDVAGEIASVGPGVSGWAVGDRVLVDPINRIEGGLMGETTHGGLAELCKARAHQLVRLPEGIDFVQAAALPVAYGTALRMMQTIGKVAAGEKVLILGASGGVGVCCLQLAKLAGAHVTACAGSDEKAARLRELGADATINYVAEDFMKAAWGLVGKPARRGAGSDNGFDVVVNFTGGDTWVKSMRVLKVGGRLLTCGATAGFDPQEDIRFIWTFELQVLGSNGWKREDLHRLLELVGSGQLKALVDHTYPLEDAAVALAVIEERKVFGKVVVTP